jgi:hypothetical protein
MDREIHHPSPEEGRRELAPALSPRMPGRQGSPGWEGQKGRSGKSDALSSPGRQRKGGRRGNQKTGKRSPWTQKPCPGQNPGAPNHNIGSWGPGVGLRRDPPQHHKGSRTTAWRPAGVQHRSVGTV